MRLSRFATIAPIILGLSMLRAADDFKEIEFAELSQRDPNPLGEKALAIHPREWKHAETDHFIYHFVHSYVAAPISREAEFHYRVIAAELEREQPPGDIKSHIYIFERPEDWQTFQTFAKLEPWTGGIQSLGSLFIQRNPAYKFSDNSLGHEIVHLVVHRFYAEGIPLWLNEGLAQCISKNAHASYQRAAGYIAKPHSTAIAPENFIPLPALVTMTQVPSDRVVTFYDESERLVRFLMTTDKQSFLKLLDMLGHHQAFEAAFSLSYPGKFATLNMVQEQFREYATQNLGTTVDQVTQ